MGHIVKTLNVHMCGAYEAVLLLAHKTFLSPVCLDTCKGGGGGGRAYSFVACLTVVIWPLTPHRFPDGAPFLDQTETPPALLCSLRLPIHYMQPFVYLIPLLFRLSSPTSMYYKIDRFLAIHLLLWCAKFVHITLVWFPHQISVSNTSHSSQGKVCILSQRVRSTLFCFAARGHRCTSAGLLPTTGWYTSSWHIQALLPRESTQTWGGEHPQRWEGA